MVGLMDPTGWVILGVSALMALFVLLDVAVFAPRRERAFEERMRQLSAMWVYETVLSFKDAEESE